MRKKAPNIYLAMWDQLGLECIIPLSELEQKRLDYEKETVWRHLASPDGEDHTPAPGQDINTMMHHMMLRARFNPQRHYEIYTITATKEVTKEDLEMLFNQNPQSAAELIRERGTKIYSDRANPSDIKIV